MNDFLTPKEKKFIELVATGEEPRDAVMQSYNCKNNNSVGVILNKLLKRERVNRELMLIREKVKNKIATKGVSFIELVERYAGGKEAIAKKMAEHIMQGEARVSDSGIDKFIKLTVGYKENPSKVMHLFKKIDSLMETPEEESQRLDK